MICPICKLREANVAVCAVCLDEHQASNSRLIDGLNANKLFMATTLTTVILERLENNKTTPEWLRGSVEVLRGMLAEMKQ